MTQINLRSPYFVFVDIASITSANIDIYIYTGTQTTDRPGSPQYSILKTAIDNKVTFEISELCRDYLELTYDGNLSSQMVWVDYQVTSYISATPTVQTLVALEGYDGYGDFEEGVQNQGRDINQGSLMQSNTIVYVKEGEYPFIPLREGTAISYDSDGNIININTTTSETESADKILYWSPYPNPGNFQQRVEADGGTYVSNSCEGPFFDSLDYTLGNVYVGGTEVNIVEVCEYKFEPLKVTFVNKFGAFQDIWFMKSNTKDLKIKEDSYKANTISQGAFSINESQNKILSKRGESGLKIVSGFVNEEYNTAIEELLLSEQVWISIGGQTLPVNVKTSSFKYKTSVNDQLISHEIDLDFAFSKINSVR